MTPLETLLHRQIARFDGVFGRLVAKRHWHLWVGALAIILSLLIHTPAAPRAPNDKYIRSEIVRTNVFRMQVAHPLTPINAWDLVAHHDDVYEGGMSHLDKLAFRLTIPFLGHILGTGAATWRILNIAAGLCFFPLLARLIAGLTGDRLSAAYWTFAFAASWLGECFFTDYVFGDGVAYIFLLLAFSFRCPPVIFASVLIAAFTDERGLIASATVPLFWLLSRPEEPLGRSAADGKVTGAAGKACLAVGAAWAVYFAIRLFLGRHFGLTTGTSMMFDPVVFWFNFKNTPIPFIHLRIYKILWLLFPVGVLSLAASGRWMAMAYYLGAFAVIGGTAAIVWDIFRSFGYAFPLLLITLQLRAFSQPNHLAMARISFLLGSVWIVPSETVLRYLHHSPLVP